MVFETSYFIIVGERYYLRYGIFLKMLANCMSYTQDRVIEVLLFFFYFLFLLQVVGG
jgi:hypothetical protein